MRGYEADKQRFYENLQVLYIGNLLKNKGIFSLSILFIATPTIAFDLSLG